MSTNSNIINSNTTIDESKEIIVDKTAPTITYTTNLKITIKQVRNGFVTYNGTSNINFNFEWKYTADNAERTNSTSVSVPLSLSDSKQSYVYTKKYEFQKKSPGSSFVIQSEIPFVKKAYLHQVPT